jgi:hypothetical protein
MLKNGKQKEFCVNKSVSLPIGTIEKILDRCEEYNRTFSEELTTLVRLGLAMVQSAKVREDDSIEAEANKILKRGQ